jgi:putative flippase GtrA
LYFAALLLTAASSVTLIAPSVHARLTWPDRRTERIVAVSNVFVVVGSSLLAAGMACAVYLIADLLYRSVLAAVVTSAVVVLIAYCWYGIPLLDRRMRR